MSFPEGNPRRWLDELRDLAQRAGNTWRVLRLEPPTIEGDLETAAGAKHFRLIWPAEFPFRPPSVWELSEAGDIVDHRNTGHAFSDRSICLFGHTPESGWRIEYTAAAVVLRLAAFLEATDRSAFPRVDAVPLEIPVVRVSVHPKLMTAIRAGSGWGMMSGWFRRDGKLIVVTSTELTSPSGLTTGSENEAPSTEWGRAMGLAAPWQGLWCRTDAALGDEPPNRQRLASWLATKIPHAPARNAILDQPFVMLVGDEDAWFVWLNPPDEVRSALASDGKRALFAVPVVEDIPSRLFLRADARLDNATALRTAHVAVVGVGSLGGTIALALAKAGVGRFSLFDPDVLEPENVARHVGAVSDIGTPKVEAVTRAIHRVNPAAQVKTVPSALSLEPEAWSIDSMASLREVLSDPAGIVVVTTATADAESIVNAACVAASVPAVFAAVLGDADHGRVFRVLPGQTACYQCVLLAQTRDPARFPRFEKADIGTPRYHSPGIPGLGMDVDEVALITARLALQTIATRIDGGVGYPPAHADHVLWSARGDWAVDGPLQTRVERIPRDPSCPVCGAAVARDLSAEERVELEYLIGDATRV